VQHKCMDTKQQKQVTIVKCKLTIDCYTNIYTTSSREQRCSKCV